jgi:hypothetical protein
MGALERTCEGDFLNASRIRISGWLNGGYTYSTSGAGRLSVAPLPNRFGDEFTLNQLRLAVERPLDPNDWSWGFDIRSWAGADAALLTPIRGAIVPNPNPRFGFDIDILCLKAHLPILTEGGLDVEVGQHDPFLGYEPGPAALRSFYSNDYQWFYGLPGVFTGVIITTHVNSRLDIVNAVTLGTPTFFTLLSDAPVYMGGLDYWLEEDKKTKITLGLMIGPFRPHSSDMTTMETVTVERKWSERFTQTVQFYACYSEEGIFVPGLERAYGLYNIFIYHLTPKVETNLRTEWYDDVDGQSYPAGTGFKTNYEEVTFGIDYHPTTWLQLRPELRGDFANDAAAFGPVGGPLHRSQLTNATDYLIKF